jgi:hypothetical protein
MQAVIEAKAGIGKRLGDAEVHLTSSRIWYYNIRTDLMREIYRVEKGGLDSSASGYGPVSCSCENDNEPSGSIKGWEFLTR